MYIHSNVSLQTENTTDMCGAAVGGQKAYDFVCMYRENSNIQSAVNRFGALHALLNLFSICFNRERAHTHTHTHKYLGCKSQGYSTIYPRMQ